MSRSQTLHQAVFQLLRFPEGTEVSDLTLSLNNNVIVDPGVLFDTYFSRAVPESIALTVTTKQKPFSKWTFNEFINEFRIIASAYVDLGKFALTPLDANATEIQPLIDETLNDVLRVSKACRHVCGGNEGERSLLIHEILKRGVMHFI